jgi:tRNA (guanine10-N2)-methyltransferase
LKLSHSFKKFQPSLAPLSHSATIVFFSINQQQNCTMAASYPSKSERYLVLVEFAYTHLDFHLAELESVLDVYGILLNGPDCKLISLPRSGGGGGGVEWRSDVSVTRTEQSQPRGRPFVILSFPSKDEKKLSEKSAIDRWDLTKAKGAVEGVAEMLVSRCTLVKSVIELWGASTSIDGCAATTDAWAKNTPLGQSIFKRVSGVSQSWKVTIHTLGSKYFREEQDDMRKKFSYLGFDGQVQMSEPDNEYVLIRETELDGKGSPLYPRHHLGKTLIPENDARPPLAVYFGRVLGGTRKGRGGLEQYNLKHRVYLGPTSMDAELSFVMTSLGQVQKSSIVFDPFVGTGSILLSCALRGAYCIGADIDIRVLKGRSDTENILTNFEQFNLQRPEILRTDNALYHRHFRSHKPLYDSIICDPPYGIRAGARKTGSRQETPRPILDEHRHDHIPQTKPYPVCDVMSDLLDMAARTVVMNGRLVYVIPSFQDFDPKTDLPRHDCLELVHCCYQPLGLELGRRIVTMKKIKDYDPSLRDTYLSTVWVNGRESAEKCANIREKIIEAAKKKPGYEEKAAIRKHKRKTHNEAKKRMRKLRESNGGS